MKVVYTEEALNDLAAIADWLRNHYPAVAPRVERRIRHIVARIATVAGECAQSLGSPGRSRRAARTLSV